jgi:hypothetical protein
VPSLARAAAFARCAAATVAAAAIAACAARPPPPPPAPPPPPPDAHESDASFDWQALLIAPMGSTLKSVPVALHEALLFHDEAGDSRVPDDGECYSPDSAPPRFLGRTPDEYLLCFRQDHLLRIRASVQLGEDAESLFHEACARWLRKADLGPGGPAGSETAAPEAAACQGRSGLVRFHARLAPDIEGSAAGPGGDAGPGSAAPAGAEDAKATTVRVVLDGFPDLRE